VLISPIGDHCALDVPIGRFHSLVSRQRHGRPRIYFSIEGGINPYLVETVCLGQELVEGKFVGYPEQYQNAAGNSDSKACDVDEGVDTIPEEVADRYDKVIFEHVDSDLWVYSGEPERYQ
jgi:hypothetical protein